MANKERLTPALLMAGTVAATVALIVACSSSNPAGPATSDAGGGSGDGKVTAACPGCFPAPVPFPGGTGGSGSPAPGGGGGGGGGVVPVPVPGAPGAPVGGPSPSTDPSASPSSGTSPSPGSSASPSPAPCTLTTRTFTSATPVNMTGGGGSVTLQASTSDPDYTALSNCRLTAIRRVSTHVTSLSDMSVVLGNPALREYLTVANGTTNVDTQTLMDAGYKPSSLSGLELGTDCTASGGFSFGDGGASLAGATAPYNGLWKPTSPTGTFTPDMLNHKATNAFTLGFLGLGADAVMECVEIVVELGPI